MKNNLLRYNKNQKYIFFDYETEGLNLYSSKPFQLSFITSEGSKETSRNDYYIDWPNLKVSSFIEKLTNLSWPVFHKTKQKPEDVLTHFEKYL